MGFKVHYGIDRRHLDVVLKELGGYVEFIPATGEVRYVHPRLPDTARANGRRKDAPAHLVTFVRRILRALNRPAANEDHYHGD